MSFETHCDPVSISVRRHVRGYTRFHADVGLATMVRAAPVRPQQFLQIVLEGDHRLRNIESGRIVRSAPATLIGLCTYRKYNLIVEGRLRLFFVHFQPGALHAISGRDMAVLTDACLDARAVFGNEISELVEKLVGAETLAEQTEVADAWFAPRLGCAPNGVAPVARAIRDGTGNELVSMGQGLSTRQFQRRFAREIGVTPKLYARLCRLAAVVDLHEAEPRLSWTELAHASGYADQAHLTREFRAFVREAPSRFRSLESAMAA